MKRTRDWATLGVRSYGLVTLPENLCYTREEATIYAEADVAEGGTCALAHRTTSVVKKDGEPDEEVETWVAVEFWHNGKRFVEASA